MKKRQCGFTWTELLVIFVVILLTAYILMPVPFYPNKEKARRAVCASNLKQIELAILQYMQDNDNTLPLRQTTAVNKLVSWRKTLLPYTKSTGMFLCPSNPYGNLPDIEQDGFNRSYAVNSTSPSGSSIGGPFADRKIPLTIDKFVDPAYTVAVTETTAAFNDFNPLNSEVFMRKPNKNHAAGYLFAQHKGSSNYAYMDGHVKFTKPELMNKPNNCHWTADTKPLGSNDEQTLEKVLEYAKNVN